MQMRRPLKGKIHLDVKFKGQNYYLKLNTYVKVYNLKKFMAKKVHFPSGALRLTYSGIEMEDDTLSLNKLFFKPNAKLRLYERVLITFYVKNLFNKTFKLTMDSYESIQKVKAELQKTHNFPPPEQQRFIFNNRELPNGYTLKGSGIQSKSKVLLLLEPAPEKQKDLEDKSPKLDMTGAIDASKQSPKSGEEEADTE